MVLQRTRITTQDTSEKDGVWEVRMEFLPLSHYRGSAPRLLCIPKKLPVSIRNTNKTDHYIVYCIQYMLINTH